MTEKKMFVTKDLFLWTLESLAKIHCLNGICMHFISIIYFTIKNYKGKSIPLGLSLEAT